MQPSQEYTKKDFELPLLQRSKIPFITIANGIKLLISPVYYTPLFIKDCLMLIYTAFKKAIEQLTDLTVNFVATAFKFLYNCIKNLATGITLVLCGIVYPAFDFLGTKDKIINERLIKFINKELQENLDAFSLENISKLPKKDQSLEDITANVISVSQGIYELFERTIAKYKQLAPTEFNKYIPQVTKKLRNANHDKINQILSPIVYAQEIMEIESVFEKEKSNQDQTTLFQFAQIILEDLRRIKLSNIGANQENFDYNNNFFTDKINTMEEECLAIIKKHCQGLLSPMSNTKLSSVIEESAPSSTVSSPRSASSAKSR